MNKSKGFTIIELIVVIAIIAILASIVLVNVTSYINKAKDSAVRSDIASVALGMGTCFAEKGAYSIGSAESCYFATADTSYIPLTLTTDIRKQNSTTTDPVVTVQTGTSAGATYCAYAKLPSLSTGKQYACIDSTGITVDISSVTLCTAAAGPKCE
jgi:prepilin-type N-terminal cleavage/methylation domain-containing protein